MQIIIRFIAVLLLFGATSCSRPPLKEQNHLGIVFECHKCSQIEIPNVGHLVVTSFQAKNVLPGKWYELKLENSYGFLDTKAVFISDINGRLLGIKDGKIATALDTIRAFENDKYPGQPSKYWLIAKDGTTAVSCTYVPYPWAAQAEDGANLSLVRDTYDAQIVTLHAKGFHPNEPLEFQSHSGAEKIKTDVICNPQGTLGIQILPAVIGKKGGKASVAMKRASGEILSIDYDWGQEAIGRDKLIAPLAEIPKKYFDDYLQRESEALLRQNK
jgi:hypothetical protein